MNKNNITIGITAYNEGQYLQEAWDSVINQTTNNWEAIMILDGGSDIKTEKVFDDISHPSLRKIKLGENNGPYHCRTLAINNTNTEWYCHLDADDLLPQNMVKNIHVIIDKYPNLQYIIGRCLYFDNKNYHIKLHKGLSDSRLAYTLPFNGQSPIKCKLFNQLGGYNESFYRGGADWDFWLKVLEADKKGRIIDDIIYERRYRKNNVGSNWVSKRHNMVEQLIDYHPKYFSEDDKKNICYSKSYEFSAREKRSIGQRKEAAKLAQKSLNFGNKNPNLNAIIDESEMPLWRYKLRRIARFIGG